MSRNATVIAVLFVLGAIGFVQAELQEAERAPAERVVSVSNFPNPQNVVGTVSVSNLPAVQTVTGTVAVSSIPAAPPAKRFQFVGITDAEDLGHYGLGVLVSACAAEFHGSRMCNSREILETSSWPVIALGPTGNRYARVRPVIIPGGGVDESGVAGNPSTLACGGYSEAGPFGLVLRFSDQDVTHLIDGRFQVWGCDQLISVACCAPV